MPTKIGVHARYINPWMHKIFEPILNNNIFSNLKANFISKTEKAMPKKIGVHALDINPYLHKFFEPILID